MAFSKIRKNTKLKDPAQDASKISVIALIGSPGSGKTTQADLLTKNLEKAGMACSHLNVGQLLRDSNDPKVKKIMNEGLLAPDEIVYQDIQEYLKKTKSKVIVLDGFFRRPSEASWLIENQAKLKLKIRALVDLKLSKKSAIQRLSVRGRADDQPSDITTRLKVFTQQRRSVLKVLRAAKIPTIKLSAEPSIEAIQNNMLKKLKPYIPHIKDLD